MKEEKEVIWLIKLYNSEYSQGGLFNKNSKSACIKDFERLLEAPENDLSFGNWIKEIKELGIIIFSEKIKIGHCRHLVDGFVVNKKEVLNRLKEINSYSKVLLPFFNSRVTLP